MNPRKFLIPLLIGFLFAPAFAGPGHSGGGDAVVFADGTVRLVDLLSPEEVEKSKSNMLIRAEVTARFYEPNRYVRQLGKAYPQFFDCAIQQLRAKASESEFYQVLAKKLSDAQVFQVQFQSEFAPSEEALRKANLPVPIVGSPSPRISTAAQQPLASYANNQIWISQRLFEKLSSDDRCGLSIHEALRQSNFSGVLQKELTTQEIEVATRYFMGKNKPDPLLPEYPRIADVLKKLHNVNPETDVRTTLAELQILNEQAKKILDIEKQRCDLTAEQRRQMRDDAQKIISKANDLSAVAHAQIVSNPLLQQLARLQESTGNGLVVSALINSNLTQELSGDEYWDVVKLSRIKR